jgi:sugar lactone lactonase YvrE
VRVAPVVWLPPPNTTHSDPQPMPPLRVVPVGATGPEDVLVLADGSVVTGVASGQLLRVDPDAGTVSHITDTGGRPLGIELLPDGALLVCDAHRGLLRVDPDTGAVTVFHDGTLFCNNAAVAVDGTIYFSDTSSRFGIEDYRADLIEHSGTGRLLRRDQNGQVEVLLEGLQFANGVALAADESYVAVCETGAYRVRRLWLGGPRGGSVDMLVDDLPGFPDNISLGDDGLIWIAMASPRDAVLDRLHRMHPVFRRLVWALPDSLQPQPKRVIWVMAVDDDGRVVHHLRRPGENYSMVTGVRRAADRLWLSSLHESALAVVSLDD